MNRDKAFELLTKALDEALRNNDSDPLLIEILLDRAYLGLTNGTKEQVNADLSRAVEIGDRGIVERNEQLSYEYRTISVLCMSARMAAAEIHYQLGQYRAAESLVYEFVACQPYYPELSLRAFRLLGEIRLQRADVNGAIVFFEAMAIIAKECKQSERYILSLTLIARALTDRSDFHAALRFLRLAVRSSSRSNYSVAYANAKLQIADIYFRVGHQKAALKIMQDLFDNPELDVPLDTMLQKGHRAMRIARGEFLAVLNEIMHDERLLSSSHLFPDKIELKYDRADLLLRVGHFLEARAILVDLLNLTATVMNEHGRIVLMALRLLAVALRGLSFVEQALKLERLAIEFETVYRTQLRIYEDIQSRLIPLADEVQRLVRVIETGQIDRIEFWGRSINCEDRTVSILGRLTGAKLTPTEFLIIKCLYENQGKTVKESDLAEYYHPGASKWKDKKPRRKKTHTHIVAIRRKIGDLNREIIISDRGVGWQLKAL